MTLLPSFLPLRNAGPEQASRPAWRRFLPHSLTALLLAAAPLADAATAASTGAEWASPSGTVQGTRYSNLTQITSGNAQSLFQEFSIPTGTTGGHEGQPLVVNIGTPAQPVMRMFVVTPWPNRLIALDTKGNTLWTYSPRTSASARGEACCDTVNRGASYAAGKVFYSRLDGTVVAVDAVKGTLVWQTKVADPKTGETLTGAPLVAGTKVIVGNAGGEMGVRGWVQGLDIVNGAVIWKAWSTGPDKDVKINPANNFYPKDRGSNLGCASWSPDNANCTGATQPWKQGGGTTWAWFTYDPDLKLVFYGTANPGVWNPDMRPGDNKWSSTIFARDPDTGVARWAFQLTPHDGWDYDAMNESIVVPATVPSGMGKALMHFDKNGFAYLFDAWTGQVISAQAYTHVSWAGGVNLATGVPTLVPEQQAHEGVVTPGICPSPLGGKEFAPSAFSPATGLFYVPGINFCSSLQPLKANYIAGTPFMGADVGFAPDWIGAPGGPAHAPGELFAWNPNGSKAWSIAETAPLFGGVLATAGNVVFYGTLDRRFNAVNATTGTPLWSTTLECGVMSNPITYLGDDGRQRVAVYTGVGWLPGGFVGGTCPNTAGGEDGNRVVGPVTSGAVHIFRLP